MTEPKYDSETLAQLAVIAVRTATEKNAKETEALKEQLAQVVKLYSTLSDKIADLEAGRRNLLALITQSNENIHELDVELTELKNALIEGKQEGEKKPQWIESLIKLFKK